MPACDDDFISIDLLKDRMRRLILERICDVPGEICIAIREIPVGSGMCEVSVFSSAFEGMSFRMAQTMLEKVLREGLSKSDMKQVSDFTAYTAWV